MNRLGGDVVRKICGMLEIMDADKDVVHLALTCKRLHHFLRDDLGRLRRIYSMSDYFTRSRIKWALKRANKLRKLDIDDAIAQLLPASYDFKCLRHHADGKQIAIWTVVNHEKWIFCCNDISVKVTRGNSFCCFLFVSENTIYWDIDDDELDDDLDDVKNTLYPEFESHLAPILAVYSQLMDQVKEY
jgi:hypothetical protein